MNGNSVEFAFRCKFCGHETRLTVATQSTVEGQPLACPVCGGEVGRLSDSPVDPELPPPEAGSKG